MSKKHLPSRPIARRISAHYQWRQLWRGLLGDLLAGFLALALWCIAAEVSVLGYFDLQGSRWFESAAASAESGAALFTIRYCFGPEGALFVNAGRILFVLGGTLGLTMSIQLLGWLLRWLSGPRRLRKFLRPIDSIAAAAQTISDPGMDEDRFRDVAEAIDHLNAASPDAKLSLGGQMTELEQAVNSLIARMHNTYRQQIRFVDDASHELRTPIAVIQGYVNMLDRWGKNDEKVLQEAITAIQTESGHMKTLVDQLLFLARGDMGRQRFEKETVDLGQMLSEIREESLLIDDRHPYTLLIDQPCSLQADPAMLKQAVRILVDNAAKYTPEHGAITLRLQREGGSARISVQDEGQGIAPADAAHVFERFYRGDKARTASGGSGLGLSIAKWIVDQHGGTIRLISYEGLGSRFSICLPMDPSAALSHI